MLHSWAELMHWQEARGEEAAKVLADDVIFLDMMLFNKLNVSGNRLNLIPSDVRWDRTSPPNDRGILEIDISSCHDDDRYIFKIKQEKWFSFAPLIRNNFTPYTKTLIRQYTI